MLKTLRKIPHHRVLCMPWCLIRLRLFDVEFYIGRNDPSDFGFKAEIMHRRFESMGTSIEVTIQLFFLVISLGYCRD